MLSHHITAAIVSAGLEKLLQNTVELSQELLLEARLDGALLEINPAWTALLGWSGHELRVTTLCDLVHPDDLAQTREGLRRAIEVEGTSAFEARCRHKDGSYRWIAWKMLARGNLLHAAGHEFTPRLTSGVAHDFNNLMQGMVASLELVRKLVASGRAGESERFIASAIGYAQRAAALNQQLLGSSASRLPQDP